MKEIRSRCIKQLENMRPDHMRRLNPTPYKVIKHQHHELREPVFFFFWYSEREINFNCFYLKTLQVSVSAELYDFIHNLWLNEAPVGELH